MIADAVIIGGGIAGVSVAYHLAEAGMTGIVLLEKELLLGSGSSAASAGIAHHHFPEPVNQLLSRASVKELSEFEAKFGAGIDFRRYGYLETAGTPEDLALLQSIQQALDSLGVRAQILAPSELPKLMPGLVTDDLLGALLTPDDGYFDPYSVIQAYAAAARRMGARIFTETPAADVVISSGRIQAIKTPKETIATHIVIDAAGPLAAEIAFRFGLHLPIRTVKRQIFISSPTTVISAQAPFYFDRTPPFYFRPESGGLLMSIAEVDPAGPADLKLDWKSADVLAESAVRRMPALASLRLMRGWAGLRSMTPDNTAILGPAPQPEGFFLAAGFSGHGVMHSPMTGKIVAAVILDPALERLDDIELAPLMLKRFLS